MALEKKIVRIVKKELLSQETYKFTLDIEPFDFLPGQFLTFILEQDNKRKPRSYSLFNPPKEKTKELVVELISGGIASEAFREATPETEFQVVGPIGKFVFDDSVQDHIFIGTNTGVVPLHSMIKEHIDKNFNFHLIFGAKYEKGLFFHDEWNNLAKEKESFTYTPTITREESATVNQGRVQQYVPFKENTNYYICGSGPMVQETVQLLKDNNISKERIHYEVF